MLGYFSLSAIRLLAYPLSKFICEPNLGRRNLYDLISIKNNKKKKLKDETEINIIAADNCNPEICGKLFGCGTMNGDEGLGNVDTMAIFNNENETIVNTNDCPFEISEKTAKIVAKQLLKIYYFDQNLKTLDYLGSNPISFIS